LQMSHAARGTSPRRHARQRSNGSTDSGPTSRQTRKPVKSSGSANSYNGRSPRGGRRAASKTPMDAEVKAKLERERKKIERDCQKKYETRNKNLDKQQKKLDMDRMKFSKQKMAVDKMKQQLDQEKRAFVMKNKNKDFNPNQVLKRISDEIAKNIQAREEADEAWVKTKQYRIDEEQTLEAKRQNLKVEQAAMAEILSKLEIDKAHLKQKMQKHMMDNEEIEIKRKELEETESAFDKEVTRLSDWEQRLRDEKTTIAKHNQELEAQGIQLKRQQEQHMEMQRQLHKDKNMHDTLKLELDTKERNLKALDAQVSRNMETMQAEKSSWDKEKKKVYFERMFSEKREDLEQEKRDFEQERVNTLNIKKQQDTIKKELEDKLQAITKEQTQLQKLRQEANEQLSLLDKRREVVGKMESEMQEKKARFEVAMNLQSEKDDEIKTRESEVQNEYDKLTKFFEAKVRKELAEKEKEVEDARARVEKESSLVKKSRGDLDEERMGFMKEQDDKRAALTKEHEEKIKALDKERTELREKQSEFEVQKRKLEEDLEDAETEKNLNLVEKARLEKWAEKVKLSEAAMEVKIEQQVMAKHQSMLNLVEKDKKDIKREREEFAEQMSDQRKKMRLENMQLEEEREQLNLRVKTKVKDRIQVEEEDLRVRELDLKEKAQKQRMEAARLAQEREKQEDLLKQRERALKKATQLNDEMLKESRELKRRAEEIENKSKIRLEEAERIEADMKRREDSARKLKEEVARERTNMYSERSKLRGNQEEMDFETKRLRDEKRRLEQELSEAKEKAEADKKEQEQKLKQLEAKEAKTAKELAELKNRNGQMLEDLTNLRRDSAAAGHSRNSSGHGDEEEPQAPVEEDRAFGEGGKPFMRRSFSDGGTGFVGDFFTDQYQRSRIRDGRSTGTTPRTPFTRMADHAQPLPIGFPTLHRSRSAEDPSYATHKRLYTVGGMDSRRSSGFVIKRSHSREDPSIYSQPRDSMSSSMFLVEAAGPHSLGTLRKKRANSMPRRNSKARPPKAPSTRNSSTGLNEAPKDDVIARRPSKFFVDMIEQGEHATTTFFFLGPEKKMIKTIKGVMMDASPKLKELVNESDTIELPELTLEGFEAMLQYIYSADCKKSMSTVVPTMAAASKFEIEGLYRSCIDWLEINLQAEDSLQILDDCLKHAEVLGEVAKQSVEKLAWDIIVSDGNDNDTLFQIFCKRDSEWVKNVVQGNSLVCTEEVLFDAITSWAIVQAGKKGKRVDKTSWNLDSARAAGMRKLSVTADEEKEAREDVEMSLKALIADIRFPVMSPKFITTNGIISRLLEPGEILDALRHSHDPSLSNTSFQTVPRFETTEVSQDGATCAQSSEHFAVIDQENNDEIRGKLHLLNPMLDSDGRSIRGQVALPPRAVIRTSADSIGRILAAELALDGRTQEGPEGLDVASTKLDYQPWWDMDLGRLCRIQKIQVFLGKPGVIPGGRNETTKENTMFPLTLCLARDAFPEMEGTLNAAKQMSTKIKTFDSPPSPVESTTIVEWLPDLVAARTFRIQCERATSLRIVQVKIFSAEPVMTGAMPSIVEPAMVTQEKGLAPIN